MTILTTPRLRLTPLEDADVGPLTAILREPEVARWWPGYDEGRVRDELRTGEDGGEYVTVFAVREAGRLLGVVQACEVLNPDYRHAGIDVALGLAGQGRGLGREAIEAVVRWLSGERGHHRLVIDPAADNSRAIRCYEAVGFRAVGVLRQYERGADGRFHDALLMELVKDDWRG
ncbi:MAG: GNAT family N-acetyltransferase [Myxococcaceae bacterium]|nr:GNAT family N-acetyltransferase [Myxococcaceae bacterium]